MYYKIYLEVKLKVVDNVKVLVSFNDLQPLQFHI